MQEVIGPLSRLFLPGKAASSIPHLPPMLTSPISSERTRNLRPDALSASKTAFSAARSILLVGVPSAPMFTFWPAEAVPTISRTAEATLSAAPSHSFNSSLPLTESPSLIIEQDAGPL